jgi:hypothetical protein
LKLDRKVLDEKKAYTSLLQTCLSIDPKYDEIRYLSCGGDFAGFSQEVQSKIEEFKVHVAKTPLIAIILLWANCIKQTKIFDARNVEMMRDLIEKKLIVYQHTKTSKLLTLSELEDWGNSTSSIGHFNTIESIRCYKDWPFELREEYVSFYINFIEWLSEATFGYVPQACDMDRIRTTGRLLKFETYIKIVGNLPLRERILAKIFYLGGSRLLEEVLSLKIEDIFPSCYLRLSNILVSYPEHVFEDLKEYIGSRKQGYVFISREGSQIDPTVPYRALKSVTNKLALDKSFTFKDFMKSE